VVCPKACTCALPPVRLLNRVVFPLPGKPTMPSSI
jgi:hypothetical protein